MDDPGAANNKGGLKNLFKRKGGKDAKVLEEEILSMVEEGGASGAIEDQQAEYIQNIFAFDDADVSDLMVHRTDVLAVEVSTSIEELRDHAVEEGFSRIPVFEGDVDNIVGVVYVKDLLQYVGAALPKDLTIAKLMREPVFVPETMSCDKLFKRLTEKHVQMAIVVDEYGGTAGIITLEDLIESIFGNIQDEYDEEEEDIEELNEGIFNLDGNTDIEDVAEELDVTFPDEDYDTISGFLIDLLGYIPEDGTTVSVNYAGYTFTCTNIEDRRIGDILAVRTQLEAEEAES